ncbi:UNVERIFIED_CONTAM: hypothetical protein HDU68_009085 [Siphonaria sp. JEL0065]|nr:hypothetical protein HDU68_009085 [Siphonaria sp. JEL0065]
MHHNESAGSKASKGVIGAGIAGFLELFMFHPLDTAAKRLINHRGWANEPGGFAKVVFKDAHNQGLRKKIGSLYKAFGYAVGYKMLQRSLQFGSHPIINDYMKKNYLSRFQEQFGDRWAKTLISGTSGFFIGTFEVILLPLDALKVKRQTGVQFMSKPPSVAGASTTPLTKPYSTSTKPIAPLQSVIQQNSFTTNARAMARQSPFLLAGLYRGASWTAVRNSIGLFALFGTSTFVKEDLFKLGAPGCPPATVTQLFIASLVGAFSSIAVAAPFDVIKVRMQATSIDAGRVSGIELLKNLIKNEGLWALTKGVVPKMIASGPKVAFSFTVAQWLSEYFSRL